MIELTEEEKKLVREFMDLGDKNVDWDKFSGSPDLALFESTYTALELAVKELVKERRKNLSGTGAWKG